MIGKPLRIGVNALYLIPGGVGGSEIYTGNLLAALARIDQDNQYFVFTNRETGAQIVPQQPNFHHVPCAVHATVRSWRLLYEQWRLPQLAKQHQLDVLWNGGFTAPFRLHCPQATVFFDLQHLRHPENFRWFDLIAWRYFLGRSLDVSRAIVTISQASFDDLVQITKLAPSRLYVVKPGVEQEFFDMAGQRTSIDMDKYILCVSTLHPHKNLELLVKVFARLRQRHTNLRLVLAGMHGFQTRQVMRVVEALGLQDAVSMPGWLPRQELRQLFRNAFAFVYPSTFEGFGMPVSEALAAGLPTACSNIPPLREICGDVSLYFEPTDPDGMYDALTRLLTDQDLRQRMQVDGPRQVAALGWNQSAQVALTCLRKLAAGG